MPVNLSGELPSKPCSPNGVWIYDRYCSTWVLGLSISAQCDCVCVCMCVCVCVCVCACVCGGVCAVGPLCAHHLHVKPQSRPANLSASTLESVGKKGRIVNSQTHPFTFWPSLSAFVMSCFPSQARKPCPQLGKNMTYTNRHILTYTHWFSLCSLKPFIWLVM